MPVIRVRKTKVPSPSSCKKQAFIFQDGPFHKKKVYLTSPGTLEFSITAETTTTHYQSVGKAYYNIGRLQKVHYKGYYNNQNIWVSTK